MRPLRQLTGVGENAFLTSIGIFSLGALMLGCSGTPDDTPGTTASTTEETGDTSTAPTTETTEPTTTTDGTGGNPNVVDPDDEVYSCVPGIPVTTQVGFLLNREYDKMVEDLLGVTTVEAQANQLPSDLLTSDTLGAIDTAKWQAYQDVAEDISKQVIAGPNKAKFIACDPATVPTCYEDTVKTFGRKAFRREVSTTELEKFMALTTIEPAGTPDQIAETLLYAFLVSPSFILVPEIGTEPAADADAPEGAIQLTQHEIAMRLSRMLWGRGPDDVLAKAADDGLLATKEQIAEQATRMMAIADKAGGQVATAHRAYAEMDEDSSHWWKADHDPALFPTYNAEAKDSMSAEYDAFFQDVAFNGGTFADLFTSPKGFVNAETAPFYGLDPANFGAELEPYEFDPAERPGFLTRAGFLSSFSNFKATSPILRGAYMAINIIGVKVGAPDPEALKTAIPEGAQYDTRRKQIDALTADVSCKKCHQEAVNPPGYLMENFNAMGVWQVTDQLGGAIETAATVGFAENDLRQLNNVAELMAQIAAHPTAKKKYAQKLVSVGMARLPNDNDACLRDELTAKLESPGYPIVNLFSDMTQAQSFRLRVRGE